MNFDRRASTQMPSALRNVSWYLATVVTAQPDSARWTKTTSLIARAVRLRARDQ